MKRLINTLLFAACCLLAFIPFSAQAQSPRLKTILDSSQVVIGDQVHLSFTLEYNPQQYSVSFPVFPDTFNHVEIVQRSRIDTITGRDFNTFKQELTLTCFDSGQWKIPPFAFSVRSLHGNTVPDLFSDSFLLKVNTIQVDTAQPFKPIFGIRKAALPVTQILLYALVLVIILGLLGFLLWYYFKRRKKPDGPKVPEKVLLPHEKALELLNQLEEQTLWQQGRDKEYHTQLTDIIRSYLGDQFGIDCFEKTSTEIMQQVKRNKFLNTCRPLLRDVLERSDMVKFAKGHPSAEEHEQSMRYAIEIIEESYKKIKPTLVPVADAPNESNA